MKRPPRSGGLLGVWRERRELGVRHRAEPQLLVLLLPAIISCLFITSFTESPQLLIKNMNHLLSSTQPADGPLSHETNQPRYYGLG